MKIKYALNISAAVLALSLGAAADEPKVEENPYFPLPDLKNLKIDTLVTKEYLEDLAKGLNKIPLPLTNKQKKLNSMPEYRPDKKTDYKIEIIKPDPKVDYTMRIIPFGRNEFFIPLPDSTR